MTAQTNPTLSIIEEGNIGFGTIRLNDVNIPQNGFKAMQLPSMYYGQRSSSLTTRYRPFHRDGFTITDADTCIYAAVAGPGNPLGQFAVPANDHNVIGWNGYLHRTDDWLMFVLGVSLEDFRAQLAGIINKATKWTTETFLASNPAENASNSSVIYITSGALMGTFWGLKFGGWTAGAQYRYYPFVVRDYSIPANNIANIYNGMGQLNQAALYNAFMNGRAAAGHYHHGHVLCTLEGLKRFYSVNIVDVQTRLQAVPPAPNIATKNLFTRLQAIGPRVQTVNYPALNYFNQTVHPIVQLFSQNDVETNPAGFNLVAPLAPGQAEAAQFKAIAQMIAEFQI